ncbi:MAG TPA: hypothetical protein VMC10_16770 [Stellaceae bacterium]|nr:hypothetical protein [Stellaceae bacterium]
MAATVKHRRLQQLADSALSVPRRRLVALALGLAIGLALPSTQAISRSLVAPIVSSDVEASSADTAMAPAAQRRPSAVTPRPMTSADRQAIFMVMMLQGPNASSQILGLTH